MVRNNISHSNRGIVVQPTTLPWNGQRVLGASLEEGAFEALPENLHRWIAPGWQFFSTRENESEVQELAESAFAIIAHEAEEIEARLAGWQAYAPEAMAEAEISLWPDHSIQPWALCESDNGGLEPFGADPALENASEFPPNGIVPCSSMRNHGVAFLIQGDHVETWLTTARKVGTPWDMDSDIGHECVHARCAPVPLLAQAINRAASSTVLGTLPEGKEYSPEHYARVWYFLCELVVVALRGEVRPGATGLPVAETHEELSSLLTMAQDVMPHIDFSKAIARANDLTPDMIASGDNVLFDIAWPAMMAMPRLRQITNSTVTPSRSSFE